METGLNESIINLIRNFNLKGIDRVFNLLLDEINITANLSLNNRTGSIEGKEDLADHESNPAPAKSALCLMLHSPLKKFKIPLCFFFSSSSVPSSKLKEIVMNVIIKLFYIDILIHCVIFDQGPCNQAMAKSFGISTERTWIDITINENSLLRVFFIFDPPHLLKSIKNNFLKYRLLFRDRNNNNQVAEIKHVRKAFEIDQRNKLSLFPKLTAKHLYPTNFDKMKCKLTFQFFSHEVSQGMKVLIKKRPDSAISSNGDENDHLSEDAMGTAILLGELSDLIDLLNNKSTYEDKVLKVGNSSWHKLIQFYFLLNHYRFDTKNNVTCLNKLQISILSLLNLTIFLNEAYGLEYTLTRRFTQDSLENLFSVFRRESNENGNLRTLTFRHVFASVMYTSFIQRKLPSKSNCENDLSGLVSITPLSQKPIAKKFDIFEIDLNEVELERFESTIDIQLIESDSSRLSEIYSIVSSYVGGYVLRKVNKLICPNCSCKLISKDKDLPEHELINLREFKSCKMIRPSYEYSKYIELMSKSFFGNVDKHLYDNNARFLICMKMILSTSLNHFVDDCCSKILEVKTAAILFATLIRHHLKNINRQLVIKSQKTKDYLKNSH